MRLSPKPSTTALGCDGSCHTDVLSVFDSYGMKRGDAFEAAFQKRFDAPPPSELNTDHVLTIIASEIDPSTERIVQYLAQDYDVPVNVVFFHYFEDQGHRYLARTWLLDGEQVSVATTGRSNKTQETWNERDWYVAFGEEGGERNWDDAVRYGSVSAGGGE